MCFRPKLTIFYTFTSQFYYAYKCSDNFKRDCNKSDAKKYVSAFISDASFQWFNGLLIHVSDDIITIDRGDNAAYRFMIKLNGPTASIKEADLDPTIGYNIVFTDRYEDETGNLAKWGFIVLKKKL